MNIKNLVLGIGIIIVFGLALWQGIEAFYPSPMYDDYCNFTRFEPATKLIGNNVQCEFPQQLRDQENVCYSGKGQPIYDYDANGCPLRVKECNYCQRDFENAQDSHSKIVFFVALIVGILAIVAGYAILSIEPVGSALMAAGVWSFFYGTVVNWRNFSNIWRFLLLLAALVLIIWIAIRLNMQKKRKGWMFWKK